MRDEDQRPFAGEAPGTGGAVGGAEDPEPRQRVRGAAGQWRPYPDVRAGFEPWRRLALAAWPVREDGASVH